MLDARRRLCCLLWVWQTSAPTTLLILGGMQGVLPCAPGTVNAGAHNTVDAQRHVWGGESYRMGVNGAHNTIGENIDAYNTAWVLSCQGGRKVLFLQVYRVRSRYCGLTCAPCLTFSVLPQLIHQHYLHGLLILLSHATYLPTTLFGHQERSGHPILKAKFGNSILYS